METKILKSIDLSELDKLSEKLEKVLNSVEFVQKTTSINLSAFNECHSVEDFANVVERVRANNNLIEKSNRVVFSGIWKKFKFENACPLLEKIDVETHGLSVILRKENGTISAHGFNISKSSLLSAFNSIKVLIPSKSQTNSPISESDKIKICNHFGLSDELKKITTNSQFIAYKKLLISSGIWETLKEEK